MRKAAALRTAIIIAGRLIDDVRAMLEAGKQLSNLIRGRRTNLAK